MSRFDIVGAEEDLILGADYDGDDVDAILSGGNPVEIFGAVRGGWGRSLGRPRATQASQAALYERAYLQAAAAQRAKGGFTVREQSPRKARRQVLPMASTGAVAAGTSVTITSRPQTIAFKPERVIIPSTIAPLFTVDDIKVGNKSQFVQSGSLPGEAFLPTLFDGQMEMDTVQTSQDFVMQITNISGAAVTFRAAVYGKSAE